MAFGTTRAAQMAAMTLVAVCAVEVAQVHAQEVNFLEMLFGRRPAVQQAAPMPEASGVPVPSYRARLGRRKLKIRYAALPVKIHVSERQKPLDMSQGAAAALLRDETLRPGDIVILKTGAHVFEGETRQTHSMRDFEPVQRSAAIDRKTRQLLARMTQPAGALLPSEARRKVAGAKAATTAATPVTRSADMRIINPWRTAP